MRIKHLTISLLIVLCAASLSAHSLTAKENFYETSLNSFELFKTSLAQAKDEQKLVLLIIGANWCHDSQALAEQLESPQVQDVITHHYTSMIVNAGWLSDLSELLKPLGHPVYFGTPSVFIINPEHEIIINRESVQRWQSAHSESNSSLAHYLKQQSQHAEQNTQMILERMAEHQQSFSRIQSFEQQQAKRLYKAYSIIGPKLAIESETGQAQKLDELWDEVRRYRYKLQHDLVVLYQSLDNDDLLLPEYQKLSFE